ncbi:recombinase family protein [Clostridium bowmanii]|nr:recombinase family protein [Clostridium bowmanii]
MCESLDRLARSTNNLLDIGEQLQVKGIHLVSSKESIETNTATGKLMLTMIEAILMPLNVRIC